MKNNTHSLQKYSNNGDESSRQQPIFSSVLRTSTDTYTHFGRERMHKQYYEYEHSHFLGVCAPPPLPEFMLGRRE
jgi:hypothetical protein